MQRRLLRHPRSYRHGFKRQVGGVGEPAFSLGWEQVATPGVATGSRKADRDQFAGVGEQDDVAFRPGGGVGGGLPVDA